MIVKAQNNDNMLITLSPNRSATWQQTKWVIIIMVTFVMFIAILWSFLGVWLVLPFAGLEVGLFAFLMYRVSLFTYSRQIIDINSENITVTLGSRKQKRTVVFQRQQLDIYYYETNNNWELPKIMLCNKNTKILVGDFLNLADRVKLKVCLEDAGLLVCKNKWWGS